MPLQTLTSAKRVSHYHQYTQNIHNYHNYIHARRRNVQYCSHNFPAMSASDAAHGPTQNARRTTAAAGVKSRLHLSRDETRDYSDLGADVKPSDSASNVG